MFRYVFKTWLQLRNSYYHFLLNVHIEPIFGFNYRRPANPASHWYEMAHFSEFFWAISGIVVSRTSKSEFKTMDEHIVFIEEKLIMLDSVSSPGAYQNHFQEQSLLLQNGQVGGRVYQIKQWGTITYNIFADKFGLILIGLVFTQLGLVKAIMCVVAGQRKYGDGRSSMELCSFSETSSARHWCGRRRRSGHTLCDVNGQRAPQIGRTRVHFSRAAFVGKPVCSDDGRETDDLSATADAPNPARRVNHARSSATKHAARGPSHRPTPAITHPGSGPFRGLTPLYPPLPLFHRRTAKAHVVVALPLTRPDS